MRKKTQAMYNKVLKLIKIELGKREIAINQSLIVIDFEKAMINAFKSNFKIAVVKGCNFHFTQAIMNHINT